MARLWAATALSVVVALSTQQTAVAQIIQEARTLLRRAEASVDSAERTRALSDAADRFGSLAANRFSPELLRELREAVSSLRQEAPASRPKARAFSAAPYIQLLDRASSESTTAPLEFQGSYSQPKVTEPAYGGHGSAMGPPPVDARSTGDSNVVSPATFEEVPCIPTKTFCGGRSKDHILESGGSGVALFDYDGDGLLDIYVITAFELSDQREKIAHHNALYKNEGNWRFRDVSKDSGLDAAAWGNGVCAGDYDTDGKLDLYVTNFGPNFLFKNNGDGTFTDKAASAGAAASGWSTGCAFFDADGDGDLDLYVARYVSTSWTDLAKAERTLVWRGGPKTMVGPKGMPGEADLFFENRGDGTFVEAADAHGLSDAAGGYGFGVITTDYDNDGWIDLFVANDTMPNFLYRNRGGGRFESVGLASGVALNQEGRAQAGMGVDAADYDGDGRVDLIVTNFAHDVNTLYRNLDGQHFEDVTAATALAAPTFARMGWGTAFFDADLDGMVDLFFANGHIYPNVDDYPELQETYRQKNQLLLNRGNRFVDVSATAGGGLQIAKSSRGLAVGDLDNDGDLDLVVSNMDDVPTVLENRQHTGHHWVGIQLTKTGMNRFCIGAQVTVEAGGRRQVREVRSGGGYLSQNDLRAFYGLGAFTAAVNIEVRMPGGATWRWQAQPIDRVLKLTLDDRR